MSYGQNIQGSGPSSPPLHHPVPQHPIPPFRSPPPAEGFARGSGAAGNPYVPQQSDGQPAAAAAAAAASYGQPTGLGGYSNLFTDPSAQIGIEVGRNAFNYGQEYIGKNVSFVDNFECCNACLTAL